MPKLADHDGPPDPPGPPIGNNKFAQILRRLDDIDARVQALQAAVAALATTPAQLQELKALSAALQAETAKVKAAISSSNPQP